LKKKVYNAAATPSFTFLFVKRTLDIVVSLCILPFFVMIVLALFFVNAVGNRGPMFFIQKRMGLDCKPFNAIKLRSMKSATKIKRCANGPLEIERITPVGKYLRNSKFDELPQIINVLKGEMSLIGPRPDYFEHAEFFIEKIPNYGARHTVRPGISGLAQTEIGYVEGVEATRKKVMVDLYYIKNKTLRLELWILWRTLVVVTRREGS
jgi:lipopolysaccharide/colanic/teichoic acid biosynthesis glycosyltransferase